VYGIFTALVVVAAQADEQELVPFYAVSVFLSFLAGLIAMVVFFYREGKRGALTLNSVGALIVAFVLVINLAQVFPLASLSAVFFVAGGLYWLWVKNGRPRGIAGAEATE
jgi:hypothetical protein